MSLLRDMNKKYAFVLDGNKSRVFIDDYDVLLDRHYYNSVTIQTFKDMFENSPTRLDWLRDPERMQYLGGVIFDPSGKQYKGKLNLWRGFSVSPKEGDWGVLKTHIFEVIADSNQELYNYILGWLGTIFQRPHHQGEVSLVMRGLKGTGKGQFGHLLRTLFGSHGLYVNNCTHVTGKFNHHLRDCAFLFLDEAFFANDKQHESVLKGLITDEVIMIEGKGANAFQSRNFLSVLMASNDEWVVPASVDERRFCVVDVSDKYIGNRDYFSKLHQATHDKKAQAAMLHDLLKLDLTFFEIRDIPETKALKDQRAHSMDSLGKWWYDVLSRGFVYRTRLGHDTFSKWHDLTSTALLYSSYMQWCNEYKLSKYDIKNERELGKYLSKFYVKKRTKKELILGELAQSGGEPSRIHYFRPAPNENGKNAYYVGNLAESRERFCYVSKIALDFDDIAEGS